MSTNKTDDQLRAVALVTRAVVETVRESGDHGASASVLYAGLMSKGCSESQFDSIVSLLCKIGALRYDADTFLYFVAPTPTFTVSRSHDCDGCGRPMSVEDKDETLCPRCKSIAREGSC
jgi:hypothetical protein